MKKLTLFVLMLSILGSSFVFAQDNLTITGQIRPRTLLVNKNFNSDIAGNSFTELRTRIGVKFMPLDDLCGMIQLQDSRIYGTEHTTMSSTSNIDLHQAFFNLKKIFGLPVKLKAGRMELAYGAQRLIGSVGWHNVGRSFDGGVLKLCTEKIEVDIINASLAESYWAGDSLDNCLYAAYGNLKLVPDLKVQPYVISEIVRSGDMCRHTLGLFLAGKVGPIAHEIEAAYQLGSMTETVDISAMMLTANFKYKLNSSLNPVIGAGIDYLSGDDGKDEAKYKVFNTLYATNHKFYGFMDYFLNIPVHTYGLGLMDIHGKAAIAPNKKLTVAAAYHLFSANADYTLQDGSTSTAFGSEIDLTLIYKYNKKVKLQGGFSLFTPGDIFKETKGEDSSTWGYLMAIVNL